MQKNELHPELVGAREIFTRSQTTQPQGGGKLAPLLTTKPFTLCAKIVRTPGDYGLISRQGEREDPYTGSVFETRWSPEAVISSFPLRCRSRAEDSGQALSTAKDLSPGQAQILRCAQDDTSHLACSFPKNPTRVSREGGLYERGTRGSSY